MTLTPIQDGAGEIVGRYDAKATRRLVTTHRRDDTRWIDVVVTPGGRLIEQHYSQGERDYSTFGTPSRTAQLIAKFFGDWPCDENELPEAVWAALIDLIVD
jgi:hypothetical protein